MYDPSQYSKKEQEMMQRFRLQLDDARGYFMSIIKPRLDRSYKLYIAYGGDRAKEIKSWQANIFVPYIQAVVETLMPRILDARPEFSVKGRSADDQIRAEKQQQLADYFWEVAKMDKTAEDFTRSALIYGTGYLQVGWRKDVRKLKFLKTKDVAKQRYEWKEESRVFYDAPFCDWVDNYNLWYDWHNTERNSKQYWFKRLVLSEAEIRRRYPMAQEKRLKEAFESGPGDLTDHASIRQEVRTTHTGITKSASRGTWAYGQSQTQKYENADQTMRMFEVFEWIRPFDDEFSVHVGAGYVPILKNASMPIPFDFKETPFIEAPYLKIPGEFEGYGIPLILENPQIMLNLIKNQRLDAAALSIHKMWVVNPLANIDKQELVTRPFGIIYSMDPNGVREVQFGDIKSSAYQEEESLKSDMRYASGVDDFSMGVNSEANSATAIRHLRESTLERVRLFVNHLGDAYSDVLRYWMDMSRQFFTKDMAIRIIGQDGEELYPLIQRDDLMGLYDYRASVLPSIAGQVDVQKKQDMDLFQLLINMPFVDPRKLTSRVLTSWGWSLDSVAAEEQPQGGMPGMEGMPPEMAAMMQGAQQQPQGGMQPPSAPMMRGKAISPDVLRGALSLLRKPSEMGVSAGSPSPFSQFSQPVNLLNGGSMPPTSRGVPSGKTSNPRGMNRGGKVNTNIPISQNYSEESNLLNRAFNIQS